jgi:hypothetical protein
MNIINFLNKTKTINNDLEYIKKDILLILKPYFDSNNEFKIEDTIYNYFLESKFDILNIFKIFYTEYIIFLNNKFFFINNLLRYFDKYNITYFNYEDKNIILNFINILNNFLKKSSNNEKNNLIHLMFKINKDFITNSTKLKQIFFSENIIEPNTLYKKIKFSNQEIFIQFENYLIKKMEYKLKEFCQISEKLGAEKIIIEYTSSDSNTINTKIDLDIFTNSIGTEYNYKNSKNNNIKIIFEYPNNHTDINLNKFYIIESILNEDEFLISKDEFNSDLEIKFLIDTRCLNFIEKYNTNFIINQINKIEQKIFMKAQNYGLSIGNLKLKNNFIKISISIDFIKISNNLNIIDGTNIHILREGFNYLINIIKKDSDYSKLLRFLYSHLIAVEKNWIKLEYDYNNINKIKTIYNNIINLNFKDDEINDIIKIFFKNNLTWDNFKKFRDIILKGSDNSLEKIYFVTFQYHDIMNNKNHMLFDIEKYINTEFDNIEMEYNTSKNIYNNDIKNFLFGRNRSISNSINITADDNNEKIKLDEYFLSSTYDNTSKLWRNSSYDISEDLHMQNENKTPLLNKEPENKYFSNKIDETSKKSVIFNENFSFGNLDQSIKNNANDIYSKPNIIKLIDTNDVEKYKIIHDFLSRYKIIIKKILYLSFKKSFEFNNGLSNNITNNEYLNFIIQNIINYYYDNDIKNLQLKFNNFYILNNSSINEKDRKNYFNLKKNIFDPLINKICIEIIENKNLNLSDSSPNIENFNKEIKLSLYERTQKIFLKYVIKYFDFENKITILINKLKLTKKIKNDIVEPNLLIPYLNEYISINKVFKNYNKYKLFFIWEDFIHIKNLILE